MTAKEQAGGCCLPAVCTQELCSQTRLCVCFPGSDTAVGAAPLAPLPHQGRAAVAGAESQLAAV